MLVRLFEACKDIKATHKYLVNAQNDCYPLPNWVEVMGLLAFLKMLQAQMN